MGGRGFEAPSQDAEGVEGVGNGERVPLPSRLGSLGERRDGFQCFPSVIECLSLRRLS